ncbi:MAG TPA: hypothetical protein VK843_05465 [Planctomycetota bacterium]|nr:hypothetical protein [Planctomycetota bacterium]
MRSILHNVLAHRAAALGTCLLLIACASSTRERLASEPGVLPDAGLREALRDESAIQGQSPPVPAAAPHPATPDPDLAIAFVSGEPIDVRSFLARTWMRSSDVSREILDRLVVERLALLEAERQEIAVSPTMVDERLESAWKALGDSLERQGRGITIAQHLRTELGVDTEYYRKQLRRESIAQLVAERVVRTWAAVHERRVVRLVELSDQKALDAFSAGLAAGRDFDSLAKELHSFKDKEPGGARVTLIKNENAELSRVAFKTPEGQIAGPISAEEGRHLMLRVEKLLVPLSGPWKEIAPAIEKSLSEDPVDDLEYVQWRAEMVKSYSVDLDPFFRLIGVAH